MKTLLLRAAPLALCLALGQPALSQDVPATANAEEPARLSAEEWREDLAFMVAELKGRHPNPYHSVSREKFDAAVADLYARIPKLQRNEIIVGLMRVAAMVGDGHTRVDPRKDPKFHFPSLPLKLYLFDDGLFIRAAAPAHAALTGAEIVEIGGLPVAEAIRRTHSISSVDNVIGYKLFAPLYLNMPDILHALGLSSSRDSATLKLRKAGLTWTTTIAAADVDPVWPPDTDISLVTPDGWVDSRATPEPPLWLEDPLDYHRLIELPEQEALYAQLNMVTNEKDQTLTQFGELIAKRAAALNPKVIVLDLRLNLGGNGGLRHGFVRELIRAEDEDTRLLVVSGRGAFSASQFILDDLDRLSKAHFIGEPASSKPSSFGDSYRTPLPNSEISIRTSIKWWQAGQNFEPWTYIDVSRALRFGDYVAGRDPALETAINYDEPTRLYKVVKETQSVAGVRKALASFIADPRNRYAHLKLQMLISAEQLALAKRLDEALLIAELAAERFPDSVDAHLVRAFVAEKAGNLDLAVEAAHRALQLDPNNRNGRSLLERVEERTRG